MTKQVRKSKTTIPTVQVEHLILFLFGDKRLYLTVNWQFFTESKPELCFRLSNGIWRVSPLISCFNLTSKSSIF